MIWGFFFGVQIDFWFKRAWLNYSYIAPSHCVRYHIKTENKQSL